MDFLVLASATTSGEAAELLSMASLISLDERLP
jgi:hypothetical protein